MHLLLLYNPVAGAGRAAAAAAGLGDDLRAAGHEVTRLETRLAAPREWLDPPLAGADVLVVMGGDGAMRMAAGPAVRAGVPVYHYPFGTENLFARAFGTDRDPGRLVAAIERDERTMVDVGIANGRMFLLMASIGYDAEVIHDLAAHRGRRITHFSYLRPMWRQLRAWRPPAVTVLVDDEPAVPAATGIVVIANASEYAMRFDPAPAASMTDGLLDMVFLPARGRRDVVRWIARCRRGTHLARADVVSARGRRVTVRAGEPQRYQLDGDPPDPCDGEPADGATRELRVELRPRALAVLLP